jgi:Citrate synthase, C-terminal domain
MVVAHGGVDRRCGAALPAGTLPLERLRVIVPAVVGMIPGAGEAIFAVARTSGWIAHALEEDARDVPLGPRAVYTGPLR